MCPGVVTKGIKLYAISGFDICCNSVESCEDSTLKKFTFIAINRHTYWTYNNYCFCSNENNIILYNEFDYSIYDIKTNKWSEKFSTNLGLEDFSSVMLSRVFIKYKT